MSLTSAFEQNYRFYPAAFIEKAHLEKGDKVIMPSSALDRLANLPIDYPMLFEVSNPTSGKTTHCGVLEFIADEGMIIIETDCEVDFAPPLDYQEPEKPSKAIISKKRQPADQAQEEPANKIPKFSAFTGSSRRLDGKPSTESVVAASSSLLKYHEPEANSTSGSTSTPSISTSRRQSGKLVFGSNGTRLYMEHQKLRQNLRRAVRRSNHKRAKNPSSKHSQGRNIH